MSTPTPSIGAGLTYSHRIKDWIAAYAAAELGYGESGWNYSAAAGLRMRW